MYNNISFKKSILILYDNYIKNKLKFFDFIDTINKSFGISKTTFYNWKNNPEIQNFNITLNYENKNITPAVEELIKINEKTSIKNIKNELKKINVFLNIKAIRFILNKNNNNYDNKVNIKKIKNKIISKKNLKNNFIKLSEENEKFIFQNQNIKISEIIKDFKNKFNIDIHEKQVVNVMYKNKKQIKSFFKMTPIIEEFLLKKINEKCIYTCIELKNEIFNEFKFNISIQTIYNILKKHNLVYKKIRKVNNPYTIEEQVKQLEKVSETHKLENIDNCISIDEISVLENALPERGWFKKNQEPTFKINNPKIFSKRYTILMASNNKKPLCYAICEKGMKTAGFIDFMKTLITHANEKSYFLLDNATIHKSKVFKEFVKTKNLKIVYNAPYHSEFNPIENIFSLFRNKLNRNETKNINNIKLVTDNFLLENNETKLKNIFNNSVNKIKDFIKKHKK